MFNHEIKLGKKLVDILKKIENKNNQDIFIQDIIVTAERTGQSHGESRKHDNRYQTQPVKKRLLHLIQLLATIANMVHLKSCCEKNGVDIKIKEDCLNTITRISLTEFALYTAVPLTEKEFHNICEQIIGIAKNHCENVHLLLSSFAVTTADDKLLNMVVYVQCGKDPKIQVITKANASIVDVEFDGKDLFSQQTINIDGFEEFEKNYSEFIFLKNGTAISNNAIFPVETFGGAKYYQAIDICLDHYAGHAIHLLVNYLQRDDMTDFLPKQVDHMITSNATLINKDYIIEETFVHVDPNIPEFHLSPDESEYQFILPDSKLQNLFPRLQFKVSEKNSILECPPFGSSLKLLIYPNRKLGEYTDALQAEVHAFNQRYRKNRIANMLRTLYPELTSTFHNVHSFFEKNQKKMKDDDVLILSKPSTNKKTEFKMNESPLKKF